MFWVLWQPRSFFEVLSMRETDLEVPVALGLLTVAVQLVIYFSNSHPVTGLLELRVLLTLLLPVVFWVGASAAFYLLSIPLTEEGSFSRLLSFTGYGMLVFLLSIPVMEVYWRVVPGLLISGTEPISREIFTLLNLGALGGISFFLAWLAYVWIFAVKEARDLDIKRAAAVVCLILGLYFAWLVLAIGPI